MPPKKSNGKQKGKALTPQSVLDAIERELRVPTVRPDPIPANSKRDEFNNSARMDRLRGLPEVRRLAPRDKTLLRNNNTHYKEANSAYMRGKEAPTECAQCANENGTQEKCVTVTGEMGEACTNCWYDKDGKKCTFWKPSKGSKKTKGRKGKKVEISEDDEDEDEEDDEAEMDGPITWDDDKEDNDEDDAAGGDDGDAGALLAGHAITAC